MVGGGVSGFVPVISFSWGSLPAWEGVPLRVFVVKALRGVPWMGFRFLGPWLPAKWLV